MVSNSYNDKAGGVMKKTYIVAIIVGIVTVIMVGHLILAQNTQQQEIQQNVLSGKGGETKTTMNPEGFKPEPIKGPDGRRGWRLRLPESRPLATPAYAEGMIFVGGGFGSYEFYALDAVTGKVKWQFHTGDDGPTAAVVKDGYVAFNTESCILYVLKTKT